MPLSALLHASVLLFGLNSVGSRLGVITGGSRKDR